MRDAGAMGEAFSLDQVRTFAQWTCDDSRVAWLARSVGFQHPVSLPAPRKNTLSRSAALPLQRRGAGDHRRVTPMKTETRDVPSTAPSTAPHAYDEVSSSLRLYLYVGAILFAGTLATSAVATVPFMDVGAHGFDKWDALLGLSIAVTKASLVAAIFMHLNHERRLIYGVILLALLTAAGCFIGTYMHDADMARDPYFYQMPETSNPQLDFYASNERP